MVSVASFMPLLHQNIELTQHTNSATPPQTAKIAQQTGKNIFIHIQFCPVTNLLTYFDLLCLYVM